MGIEGPSTFEQRYPILAYWQYGLGKAVAFTSDARSRPGRSTWDQEWVGSDMYKKFWEQSFDRLDEYLRKLQSTGKTREKKRDRRK